jgi:hypothetical protein
VGYAAVVRRSELLPLLLCPAESARIQLVTGCRRAAGCVAVIVIALMVLYPPWRVSRYYHGTVWSWAVGYSYIWKPIHLERSFPVGIDAYRLTAQIVGVVLVTAGLLLAEHFRQHHN